MVCPEMCVTGYCFLRDLSRAELDLLAEPVPDGPTTLELLGLREHGISVGAGFGRATRAICSTATLLRCRTGPRVPSQAARLCQRTCLEWE